MPTNRKFKDQVRALAEERGIKYTEALREIEKRSVSLALRHGVYLSFLLEGARMYLPARLSEEFISSGNGLFESGFEDIDICASYEDDYLFSAAEARGDSMLFAAEENGGTNDISIADGTTVSDWFSVLAIPEDGILTEAFYDVDPEMTPVLDYETYDRLAWSIRQFNSLMDSNGFVTESALPMLSEAVAERNAA